MNEPPLQWVKEIHSALIEAGTIPLSGYPPKFPWEELSSQIDAMMDVSEIKLIAQKTSLLSGSDIASGFGSEFTYIALDLTPLNEQVFWLMGKEEIAALTTLALTSSALGKGLSSLKFQEGFYYYLITQIIEAVNKLKAFSDLALKMAKPSPPIQEESLCIDIQIQHPKQTLWGRLVCPASFHQAFKAHFAAEPPPPLTSSLANQIDVTVHLELGQTQLPLSQWTSASVGDFILLDRCTFDPKTQKGTATLVLEQTPILRARIKDTHLKIVDYAFYRQEQNQMSPKTPEDEENHQEHSESDEFSSVEFEEETSEEDNHLWSSQNDNTEKMISTQDIPLTLSVEVARLRINLQKLLQLSPGNILELPVRPEQGVDVVIGGKKVARAELIKLGEMLGIKILQMGE
jgi:flagellar motor switch protein FliN/FliY